MADPHKYNVISSLTGSTYLEVVTSKTYPHFSRSVVSMDTLVSYMSGELIHLGDLGDVTLASNLNGQYLMYNGTTAEWNNVDLKLPDTNRSHFMNLVWNENEATANRTLNLLVVGGDRSMTLNESFTIGNGSDVSITAEDAAGAITLDNSNFEVERAGATQRLLKLAIGTDAAATLSIEGTNGVIDQDLSADSATAQLATLTMTTKVHTPLVDNDGNLAVTVTSTASALTVYTANSADPAANSSQIDILTGAGGSGLAAAAGSNAGAISLTTGGGGTSVDGNAGASGAMNLSVRDGGDASGSGAGGAAGILTFGIGAGGTTATGASGGDASQILIASAAGGNGGTVGTGGTGSLMNISLGDGGTSTDAVAGNGGYFHIHCGNGGSTNGTLGGHAGDGGVLALNSGLGGGSGVTNAGNGGAFTLAAFAGGASTDAGNGGNGGLFTISLGAGGATTTGASAGAASHLVLTGSVGGDGGTVGTGGAGSYTNLTLGAGGTSTDGNAGAGGYFHIHCAAGGAASGAGDGGAGGEVLFEAGNGGAAGAAGTGGAGGNVEIAAGDGGTSIGGVAGAAGVLTLRAGDSPTGGGTTNISAGAATAANNDGGDNRISGGQANGTGINGDVILGHSNTNETRSVRPMRHVMPVWDDLYFWKEDFDEEAAAVTLAGGLRVNEWTTGGTNSAAGHFTYIQGPNGRIQLSTGALADDSDWMLGLLTKFETDRSPVFEGRFSITTATDVIAYSGISTAGVADMIGAGPAYTPADNSLLIAVDSSDTHGFGATAIVVITRNGGVIEALNTGLTYVAGQDIIWRVDLTTPAAPRIWINTNAMAINTRTNEIALVFTAGIDAATFVTLNNGVQALGAAARTLTCDYFKVWQERI